MSAREKKITVYSRNGIKIERIDFLDMTKRENQEFDGKFIINTIATNIKKKGDNPKLIPAKKAWDEVITKTSKLGFYYYHTIHHSEEKSKIIYSNTKTYATLKKYTFQCNNKRYELSYPISCYDVSINIEIRPWDILPGYKGIDDHFITDLYKDVITFFNIAEDNKVRLKTTQKEYSLYRGSYFKDIFSTDMSWVEETKKSVMRDLFGNENGPSVNYNDIKILSHGFDLKQSFRKRKES